MTRIEFHDPYPLTPTIPFVDPMSSHRFVWTVKMYALRPLYLQMRHGRVPA